MKKSKVKPPKECNNIELGFITLEDEVYVTDPCYSIGTWCQALVGVSPGKYKCFAIISDEKEWGNRVSELHVVKENLFNEYRKLDKIPYKSEPFPCCIGVDSGQCGIFDAKYYEEHQPDNDYYDVNSWYRRVCELTNNAGIIDNLGVVSSSGYGDGRYPLFVAKENKEVVAMKVVFISH